MKQKQLPDKLDKTRESIAIRVKKREGRRRNEFTCDVYIWLLGFFYRQISDQNWEFGFSFFFLTMLFCNFFLDIFPIIFCHVILLSATLFTI